MQFACNVNKDAVSRQKKIRYSYTINLNCTRVFKKGSKIIKGCDDWFILDYKHVMNMLGGSLCFNS